MKYYRIYAGLATEGAKYQYTGTYENEDEALGAAYETAIDIYQSYEGYYGIMTWHECALDVLQAQEILDEDATEEDVNDLDLDDEILDNIDNVYHEQIENTMEYYVRELTEDDEEEDE